MPAGPVGMGASSMAQKKRQPVLLACPGRHLRLAVVMALLPQPDEVRQVWCMLI